MVCILKGNQGGKRMKKLGKRKNVIVNSIEEFACVLCSVCNCISTCSGSGAASSIAGNGISSAQGTPYANPGV